MYLIYVYIISDSKSVVESVNLKINDIADQWSRENRFFRKQLNSIKYS